MSLLVLSEAAERDLESIGEHSRSEFGQIVAAEYMRDLARCLERILDFPTIGRSRGDLRLAAATSKPDSPVLRSLRCRSHIIFYRVQSKHIGILRILHGRRDPASLLRV